MGWVWSLVVVRMAISSSSTATPHEYIQIHFNFYLGNFKKLQELKMRCNYLNKLECSWNINSRFDKAAFNFLLHFCLLKEVTFLESGVLDFFLFSQ